MAEVRFSPEARRQITEIVQARGEQAGSSAEDRLRAAFDRFLAMVYDFPRVGTRIYATGDHDFRQFPVEGFMVRFCVRADGSVAVVDVRHGSMRTPRLDVLEQRAERAGEEPY